MKRLFTLTLVFIVVTMFAFGQNLISNSGFETDTDWAVQGGAGIVHGDASNAHFGDSYLGYNGTLGAWWQSAAGDQVISSSDYSAGEVVTATGWINIASFADFGNPTASRAATKLEKINWGGVGDRSDLNAEDYFTTVTSGWIRTCISVAVPTSAHDLKVVGVMAGEQNGASADVKWDDIHVTIDQTGLANPGFETTDLTGWTPSVFGATGGLSHGVVSDGSSASFDNHYGYGNGDSSYQITGTNGDGSGDWGIFIEQPVTVGTGSDCIIRADVKVQDLVTTVVTGAPYNYLLIVAKFEEGTWPSNVETAVGKIDPLSGNTADMDGDVAGWVNVRGEGVSNGDATQKLVVGLFGGYTQVSGTIWVDNVSFAAPLPATRVESWLNY
jgi:hypothetical protein